ncbi:hypothetical protein BGW42_006424 [Actinomortierella wolfii]|nr:hypothetical protein BGW42_006424 [Actinomortierella wolfii]
MPDMPYGEDYYYFQQSLMPGNEDIYVNKAKMSKSRNEREDQDNIKRRNSQRPWQDDEHGLHNFYQQMVGQEPGEISTTPTWPSYMMLARLAFVYILLQFTTPSEIYQYVRKTINKIQFGTADQLWFILGALMLHAVIINVGDWITMIEMLFNPGLDHIEMAKRSFRTRISKMFRRSIQKSLHSTLSLWLTLLAVGSVGLFASVLTAGVAYDIQGILSLTHQRVTGLQQRPAAFVETGGLVVEADKGLTSVYTMGLKWLEPVLYEAFPLVNWTPLEWATQLSNVVVVESPSNPFDAYQLMADDMCPKPLARDELDTTPAWFREQDYNCTSSDTDADSTTTNIGEDATMFSSSGIPLPQGPPVLYYIPWTWKAVKARLARLLPSQSFSALHEEVSSEPRVAINLSQVEAIISVLKTYDGFDTESMIARFNWFNDFLFRCILFMLTLTTLTGLKVSPLQRIGWLIDQALATSTAMNSLRISNKASPGRLLAKHMEYAISGTFFAMFKLSVYHTIFTVFWTYHVAQWTTNGLSFVITNKQYHLLRAVNSDDFVPVKYAWLTSLAMVVLTLFPIAPAWLASIPGAIIHFYVYGRQWWPAVLLVLGHLVVTIFVDGPVWDTHVVRSAQPGTSSAFWLGLWVYLGGIHWGLKGLLLGPVFYAAVPSIWVTILELRRQPFDDDDGSYQTLTIRYRKCASSSKRTAVRKPGKTNGIVNRRSHQNSNIDSGTSSSSYSDYNSDSEESIYEVQL